MRRCLLFVSGLAAVVLLAGCGNKGPLVRPPGYSAAPAATTSTPAAATSAPLPVPAAASTAPEYQP